MGYDQCSCSITSAALVDGSKNVFERADALCTGIHHYLDSPRINTTAPHRAPAQEALPSHPPVTAGVATSLKSITRDYPVNVSASATTNPAATSTAQTPQLPTSLHLKGLVLVSC